MSRNQHLGLLLLLAGGIIAFFPWFRALTNTHAPMFDKNQVAERSQLVTNPNHVQISLASSVQYLVVTPAVATQGLSMSALIRPTRTTYLNYLLDRASREAQAAAQRAASDFMKEMMAPVEANDCSFADRLYTIWANAMAVTKNESEYRDYVAQRFHEELTRSTDIRKNLDAIAFEYLTRLDRISQQTAIESGLDVTSLPAATLTITDFDKTLRADVNESVGPIAASMRSQSRQGTAIQAASFVGAAILMPKTGDWRADLLVDLAISEAITKISDMYRDPVGQVAIDVHRAAENLAKRICFGTDQHQGLYGALLDIAQYKNAQLRETLMHSESISEPARLNEVFEGNHE